jgi:DNA-binding Lrp family transcriptional regulator
MCGSSFYPHSTRRTTVDQTDRTLLLELERGLPLVPAPFEEIGKRLGLQGDEVMERIQALKAAGLIRKLRARIDQRKLGITANALVAWKPAGLGTDEVGKRLATFPSVTHCYERMRVPGRWEYTLYTVHHGYSRERVLDEVRGAAEQSGCPDYLVLFSTREFKRVPNVRMQKDAGNLP